MQTQAKVITYKILITHNPKIFLLSPSRIVIFCFKRRKHCLSFWLPRWQQFPWSVIVTTVVQSTSGGWHAVEGAQSSNSVSSTAPLSLPQTGVRGPVPSTHNAPGVWWLSTHDMDGPLFGYLVRICVWCYVSGFSCGVFVALLWTWSVLPWCPHRSRPQQQCALPMEKKQMMLSTKGFCKIRTSVLVTHSLLYLHLLESYVNWRLYQMVHIQFLTERGPWENLQGPAWGSAGQRRAHDPPLSLPVRLPGSQSLTI